MQTNNEHKFLKNVIAIPMVMLFLLLLMFCGIDIIDLFVVINRHGLATTINAMLLIPLATWLGFALRIALMVLCYKTFGWAWGPAKAAAGKEVTS